MASTIYKVPHKQAMQEIKDPKFGDKAYITETAEMYTYFDGWIMELSFVQIYGITEKQANNLSDYINRRCYVQGEARIHKHNLNEDCPLKIGGQ